jgi:hypothetical protein
MNIWALRSLSFLVPYWASKNGAGKSAESTSSKPTPSGRPRRYGPRLQW